MEQWSSSDVARLMMSLEALKLLQGGKTANWNPRNKKDPRVGIVPFAKADKGDVEAQCILESKEFEEELLKKKVEAFFQPKVGEASNPGPVVVTCKANSWKRAGGLLTQEFDILFLQETFLLKHWDSLPLWLPKLRKVGPVEDLASCVRL
eukprot:101583-Amphidinium_carterae.1